MIFVAATKLRRDVLRDALAQYVENEECNDEEDREGPALDEARAMLDELNAELAALAEV